MIQITEIFPNPKGKDGDNEWIELTNTDPTTTANLTNYTIDDMEGGSKPYKIQPNNLSTGTALKPNQCITLKKSETKLNLNNTGDTVRLFDQNNELVDSVTYGKSEEGKSFAKTKIISAQGEKAFFMWTSPSPNSPNKPIYQFTGTVTTSPEIGKDFYFTFQPENSKKEIKITFTDPPLDFETARVTLNTGTKTKLLTSKTSNQEFSLIDYKIESTQAQAQTQAQHQTSTSSHSNPSTPLTTTTFSSIIPVILIALLFTTIVIMRKIARTTKKSNIET